jgi:hypothetical protein
VLQNFWLMLNFADPHNHLHWLYRQLHKAELNKEKVVLIGHIPPGSESCLGNREKKYFKIAFRRKDFCCDRKLENPRNSKIQQLIRM